jgi:peptidyl-prolyl cis-trans isomerase D
MIENIRKYTGLIIVFFALVVVALVFGIKDDIFRGGPTGQPVMKISGRTYNDKEFHNFGSGSLELANLLARSGDFDLFSFVLGLTSGATGEDQAAEQFFTNRMILRQAREEFGVHPGDQEVTDYIKSMRSFAGADGKFNNETYRNFIERGIGRLGMTENDLRELATDAIATRRITKIVGTGLGVSRDIAATEIAMRDQRISGHVARLEIDAFEAQVQPTDEQIKEYWESIQDAFVTEPLRKFTYIIATPDMPAEEPEEPEVPETISDAAASDEEKKAAEEKKAGEKAKKAAELAEARRAKQIEIDSKVDDFSFRLEEQQGAGFEKLAAEYEWEVVTTDFSPRSKPPVALDINLRSSSRGGKAVDELFRIEPTTDPISKISQPIAIGENQWLVARLDEVKESRPKTFEEAKDEVRDRYIQEKAAEAMRTAAKEAAEKIKQAVAEGKSFDEAAKSAGIDKTSSFTNIKSTHQPDPANEPSNLFEAARYINPGSLAEIIMQGDRAFILHVALRELEKSPDAAQGIDAQLSSQARSNENIAFIGWLADRAEAANVQHLGRR